MFEWLTAGFTLFPPVRLEDERIVLRPPRLRDWGAWAELRGASRSFLTPWEPSWPADVLARTTFNRRLQRQSIEWREDQSYTFLTFRKGTDAGPGGGTDGEALVGGIGIGNVRRGVAQCGTIGYWVGQPYARRHYTSAAVRLALDHAFGALGLHRIEASCLPNNEASRGLLEKAGFRHEGCARGYLRINGLWRDHLMFAILREDWMRS
jgi:ribosomal-protein-alanine N-acetyltransferase